MRKAIFYGALFWIIFILIISIIIYAINHKKTSPTEFEQTTQIGQEPVTDECVEEGRELLATNATQSKVSPNAIVIEKRYYPDCGHTTINYVNATKEIINLTENKFKDKYKQWNVEGFSSNEIVIKKEENGICNEHYLLQEEDGGVAVYGIDEKNQSKLLQRTGIIVEYLTKTDKVNLKNGIRVNGKENLNKLLEDFE